MLVFNNNIEGDTLVAQTHDMVGSGTGNARATSVWIADEAVKKGLNQEMTT